MNRQGLLVKLMFVIFFVLMIAVNVIKGGEISAISELNKPFIQPAGFTFSIWSIIYFGLGLWLIFSFLRFAPSVDIYMKLKYSLPFNFTLNALWVLTYTSNQILLSCFVLTGLLLTNIFIFYTLKRERSLSIWFTAIFSIYFAWVTVATIVNIFFYVNTLTPSVWTDVEQTILTSIALFILLLFALYMLIREADWLVLPTIIWALMGIAFNKANTFVNTFAGVLSAILTLVYILYIRGRVTKKNV